MDQLFVFYDRPKKDCILCKHLSHYIREIITHTYLSWSSLAIWWKVPLWSMSPHCWKPREGCHWGSFVLQPHEHQAPLPSSIMSTLYPLWGGHSPFCCSVRCIHIARGSVSVFCLFVGFFFLGGSNSEIGREICMFYKGVESDRLIPMEDIF